jgi:hypothetical protein
MTENGDGRDRRPKPQQDFATMILDNLRKAGVQNTARTSG